AERRRLHRRTDRSLVRHYCQSHVIPRRFRDWGTVLRCCCVVADVGNSLSESRSDGRCTDAHHTTCRGRPLSLCAQSALPRKCIPGGWLRTNGEPHRLCGSGAGDTVLQLSANSAGRGGHLGEPGRELSTVLRYGASTASLASPEAAVGRGNAKVGRRSP